MKKFISIFFIVITSFIFAKEPLTVKIPINLTDMYLYKNLENMKVFMLKYLKKLIMKN